VNVGGHAARITWIFNRACSRDQWRLACGPWQGESDLSTSLPANANNYFSLAVFRPDEAGHFRRRKTRFYALHAVMLDDIGTKVAMERLTIPPSWLLETSPGNHQAGYVLSVPLTDGSAADRLMNAIVDAGLCDPGAALRSTSTLAVRCRRRAVSSGQSWCAMCCVIGVGMSRRH
jgi:hypothetical protein